MTSPESAQNKEIDCLSPEAQRLAEARLAAKRAARAEAREIRMKELERQQKEVEERPDKDFAEKGSRNMPSLSAATLASLGGTSSRRGSGDTSISIDTEASIREIKELNELKDQIQDVEGKYMQGLKEMKDSLAEVEEKYKKAMVSNAQLDNEKTNFMYQVDTLKDTLLELEEQLAESQRLYEEKNKEFEREKHAHSILQFQFAEVKEALRQREDMLEKHGIILNSDIAANGETSVTLNNVGYQGPSKMTKEEFNALASAGDGVLGKAKGMEVKNEIVGKREILQNTEPEQHKADMRKASVDKEVLRPSEGAEDQEATTDSAPAPGPPADAACEQQAQSQVLENSLHEHPERVESHEVTDIPDGRISPSVQQSDSPGDLGLEAAAPVPRQGGSSAAGTVNHGEDSVGSQQEETAEALNAALEGVSSQPYPESVPPQAPRAAKPSCADTAEPSGNPVENVEAGDAEAGEQAGPVPPSPLAQGSDGRCVADGLDLCTRQSSESEPTEDTAEPRAGGKKAGSEVGAAEGRDENSIQAGAQAEPTGPTVQSSQQDTGALGRKDAESTPPCANESEEEKSGRQADAAQAEVSDSPQKKTKSRKKKNKKKKSPAPVEALQGTRKGSACENAGHGEDIKQQQKQAADTQDEATKASANGPENLEAEQDGRLSPEKAAAEPQAELQPASGDSLPAGGDAPSADPQGEEFPEAPANGLAGSDSPECEDANGCSPKAAGFAWPGEHMLAEHASLGQEPDDQPGEPGDCSPDSGRRARSGSEKGKNKEDCTMS